MPDKTTAIRDNVPDASPAQSDQRLGEATTTAQDKVLQTLRTRPASTAAEIAIAAGVSRSTASKILTVAEHDRRVRRTPGATDRGRRAADRWTLTHAEKPQRLARGALRDMIAEFLAAHPGTEFGTTEISKALDRSSGAITNALTKLTETGHATQTSERPLRYTANPNR